MGTSVQILESCTVFLFFSCVIISMLERFNADLTKVIYAHRLDKNLDSSKGSRVGNAGNIEEFENLTRLQIIT